MTVLLFVLMIHERSREFASLRTMGASRSILSGIVTREAVSVNLLGGLIGIALSAVVIIGFSNLIGQKLGVGFVIPSILQILPLALLSLFSVLLAAVLAALISVRQVSKIDAALVLKEGE